MIKEIFKDIPGFEGFYQASNFGNIKSVKRFRNGTNNKPVAVTEKVLKKGINKNLNRYNVILSKEGTKKTFLVSQLVAMAFLDHKPNGHKIVVDHIDNDPLNDNLNNLQLLSTNRNVIKDVPNVTGYSGVNKMGKRFQAKIRKKGRQVSLGCFDTPQQAHEKYLNELKKIEF